MTMTCEFLENKTNLKRSSNFHSKKLTGSVNKQNRDFAVCISHQINSTEIYKEFILVRSGYFSQFKYAWK